MSTRRLIDWPYVVGLLLLPIILVGIAYGVRWVQDLTRWDPALFESEYVQRYDAPGAVAIDLERALRQGDGDLLRQLQGTKAVDGSLEARPKLIFALLWAVEGDYFDYLYFNASNYHREIQHIRMQDSRYVMVPDGFYYYMDSGSWLQVASPLVFTWWILVLLFTAVILVYRYMARWREHREQVNFGPRQE